MESLGKQHFNYLVSFTDLTLKTGVTSSPFFRLQDFIQEATRHSIKVDSFEITSPSKSKRVALSIESAICNKFSYMAIEGHREWFKDDYSWIPSQKKRKTYIEKYHFHYFQYMSLNLNELWDKHNNGSHIRLIQRCRKLKDPYVEVKKLASELGLKGGRIRAKLATEMANEIICSVNYENSLVSLKKSA